VIVFYFVISLIKLDIFDILTKTQSVVTHTYVYHAEILGNHFFKVLPRLGAMGKVKHF